MVWYGTVYDSHWVSPADPLWGSDPNGGHWSFASARRTAGEHPLQSDAVTSLIKLTFTSHRGDQARERSEMMLSDLRSLLPAMIPLESLCRTLPRSIMSLTAAWSSLQKWIASEVTLEAVYICEYGVPRFLTLYCVIYHGKNWCQHVLRNFRMQRLSAWFIMVFFLVLVNKDSQWPPLDTQTSIAVKYIEQTRISHQGHWDIRTKRYWEMFASFVMQWFKASCHAFSHGGAHLKHTHTVNGSWNASPYVNITRQRQVSEDYLFFFWGGVG